MDWKLYPTRQQKLSLIHEAKRTCRPRCKPTSPPTPVAGAHSRAEQNPPAERQNPESLRRSSKAIAPSWHRSNPSRIPGCSSPILRARICAWRSSRAHPQRCRTGPRHTQPAQCSRLPAAGDAQCARASANAGRAERSGMRTTEPERSAMHDARGGARVSGTASADTDKKQRSDERMGSSWCALTCE